jgi:hypothetical protein
MTDKEFAELEAELAELEAELKKGFDKRPLTDDDVAAMIGILPKRRRP